MSRERREERERAAAAAAAMLEGRSEGKEGSQGRGVAEGTTIDIMVPTS